MSNWTTKRQREIIAAKKVRLRAFLWTPVSFVAGMIFTLLANQWLVPLLPGPRAQVNISGLRSTQANSAGCTFYTFMLSTDQPLDYAYAKIAFPQNIKGVKVGFPAEFIAGESQRMMMQAWEAGRNSGGECDVIQAAVNLDVGVSSTAVSNVLTVRTSQLAEHDVVMGIVAVSTSDSAMKSAQPVFGGEYAYSKWGQQARRKLQFNYSGVAEAK